jgi:hypothetical protein
MPDEPLADFPSPQSQLPIERIFDIPAVGREAQQRLSTEATQLWRDLGHQFSSRTIADQLLQTYGTLPPTRITDEDARTSVIVQGNLAQRTAALEATSNLGIVTMEVRGQQHPQFFHVPALRELSYNFNALSADEQAHLRVWSDRADRAPNIDFGFRANNTLGIRYERNAEREIAGLDAVLGRTTITAAHDFRQDRFNLRAVRSVQDRCHLGVQFDNGPGNYYNFGVQLRLGASFVPSTLPPPAPGYPR